MNKSFTSFVRKEFLHIFRDRRTMIILLLMPIILILLFGYAVTNEVKDTRLAVVDLSHDAQTAQIKQRFASNAYFTLSSEVASVEEAERAFERGDIDIAVVFGEGFASDLLHGKAQVQLLIDGSEPNQAATRQGYAMQVLASYQQEMVQSMAAGSGAMTAYQIETPTRLLYNPQSRSEYNFVPGMIGLVVMLICAMMTSVAIVREKEQGTMEILLASPLPPIYIILAKLVPYFIISCVNIVTILMLSYFLLGVPMAGSPVDFVVINMLYLIVSLALGLFISTCVNSQLAAMLLSLLLIVPTMYFSGMVFMIESMPVAAQYISAIIPARWFMDALRRIMIQGVETQYIVKNAAILALMAVVIITVSIKLFKIRLE